ncbi:MAG: hypothetical protein AB7F40_00310 [Victivallaceae bacterium]|nr:hypothetical protein [Victivallaceae bacterium]
MHRKSIIIFLMLVLMGCSEWFYVEYKFSNITVPEYDALLSELVSIIKMHGFRLERTISRCPGEEEFIIRKDNDDSESFEIVVARERNTIIIGGMAKFASMSAIEHEFREAACKLLKDNNKISRTEGP